VKQSIGLPVNGFFLPMKSVNNIAIIVAGGSGSRMANDLPKQYIEINGKSILNYCIELFFNHPLISHIVVVVHSHHVKRVETMLSHFSGKSLQIALGGEQRYHSVYNGLMLANAIDRDANVLIHDAVRANTNCEIITEIIAALSHHEAACPVAPVTDTLLRLTDGFPPQHINRNEIKLVQTPQGFHLQKILFAYSEFMNECSFEPTDDTSIYLRYAFHPDLELTKGSYDNFKITFPADVFRFKSVIENGHGQ